MSLVKYAPTLGTGDTTRGPSSAIWNRLPVSDYDGNPFLGTHFFDDFLVAGNANMSSAYANGLGRWSCYGYAGAQINDGVLEGGVIKMSSDGDNEGLTLLGSAGSYRFQSANSTTAPNYSQPMLFECRIAKSNIATAHLTCFAGLMEPTLSSGLPATAQPLTTTDDTLMTAGGLFGFLLDGTTNTRGGPTEVSVAFVKASGTINYPITSLIGSTGQTVLANDGYIKLGFIFDPTASAPSGLVTSTYATARQTAGNLRRKIVRFFVNGVESPAFLSSDDLANATSGQLMPLGFMSPVLSVMNMASQSSDYLAVDWIRVAQAANS